MLRAELPLLASVTDCALLGLPNGRLPKLMVRGDKLAEGDLLSAGVTPMVPPPQAALKRATARRTGRDISVNEIRDARSVAGIGSGSSLDFTVHSAEATGISEPTRQLKLF